jgi:hypothetical protein
VKHDGRSMVVGAGWRQRPARGHPRLGSGASLPSASRSRRLRLPASMQLAVEAPASMQLALRAWRCARARCIRDGSGSAAAPCIRDERKVSLPASGSTKRLRLQPLCGMRSATRESAAARCIPSSPHALMPSRRHAVTPSRPPVLQSSSPPVLQCSSAHAAVAAPRKPVSCGLAQYL